MTRRHLGPHCDCGLGPPTVAVCRCGAILVAPLTHWLEPPPEPAAKPQPRPDPEARRRTVPFPLLLEIELVAGELSAAAEPGPGEEVSSSR